MNKICSLIILTVSLLFLAPINIHASEVDGGAANEAVAVRESANQGINEVDNEASGDDGSEHKGQIMFEDIEKEILDNNPAVLINQNAINAMEEDYKQIKDTRDDLEDDRDDLDDAIDRMDLQIKKLQQDRASLETRIDGDQDLINHIKSNYDALIGIYQYNKDSLINSRKSLREQQFSLDDQAEDMDDAINKLRVQSKMSECQLVWTAQNLYITFNVLRNKETDLENQTELMQKQLEIAILRESLGQITKTDITTLELKIKDLQIGLNDLQTQKKAVLGEFNLMLGNNYDFTLTLNTELKPVYENFNEENYNKDLKSVLENNYSIALQSLERETKQRLLNRSDGSDTQSEEAAEYNLENEKIKLEETKRDVSFSFDKVYEEVLSKKMSFEQESKKFEQAGTNRNYAIMKHELGRISDLELEIENSNYRNQEINTDVAEFEYIRSYLKYDWMINGLTF
ncbi:hypothetical protein Ana3638_08115 [Anaerocolumna sedimenticola]|uniref:Outer membrane efflux protein n=1 Tax=Anaerocolumna sedimenticola TaxID=2696063 RepID=A0A6P1TJX7_9FIRM|nr:TolC family protein [Anaerocolumna sedimenticola]QHQ60743.1 hypothetical protein Ana3638_08115 [Anaerocolumna sedimenticola]